MQDIIKREELIALFDIYKDLLTEKQKTYFMDYYYSDLSLAEIAENYNVSRNAVHDMLKNTEAILDNYEEKLHIHQKNTRILDIINKNESDSLNKIKQIIEE
jgi:uncharacterized protein